MKILIVACWLVFIHANAAAQLSDLRQSRQPLSGVSDISRVGISVKLGSAHELINSDFIASTLQFNLETFGYRVIQASRPSPDGLWIQIDCQALGEKNSLSSRSGNQQPSEDSVRIAPPCQFIYLYQQEVIPWKNVDRLIYAKSVSTMQQIAKISPPLNPRECVKKFFHLYDVPVLMAAEWGHVDRLLQVLNRSETSLSRQRLILTALGETRADLGYAVLVEKLKDVQLAKEAAEALGFFGLRAQKYLLPILQDRSNSTLQAAAAKGLGSIAAATGNSQQTPLFMKMVMDSSLDIRVRTQLVWAFGKAPDMRAFPTLLQLEKHIWDDPSQDPQLEEFRAAVDLEYSRSEAGWPWRRFLSNWDFLNIVCG